MNTRTSAAIRADLTENARALQQAREDVTLYKRLTEAEALTERLVKKGNALTSELAKVSAVEDKDARVARYAGLRELEIAEIPGDKSTSVLSNTMRISYTRDTWHSDANTNLPQRVATNGFQALPPNVFGWIMECHPEKIPASIAALAPGDIRAAMDRYFIGLRRGYLTA